MIREFLDNPFIKEETNTYFSKFVDDLFDLDWNSLEHENKEHIESFLVKRIDLIDQEHVDLIALFAINNINKNILPPPKDIYADITKETNVTIDYILENTQIAFFPIIYKAMNDTQNVNLLKKIFHKIKDHQAAFNSSVEKWRFLEHYAKNCNTAYELIVAKTIERVQAIENNN